MNNTLRYKGYIGNVSFSEKDEVFHGKIIGIRDLITFEGDTVSSLVEDFHNAVDEYEEFCKQQGKQPDKPYKGTFNVRIQPELHRAAATQAALKGKTLNAFVEESIQNNINQHRQNS